MNRVSAGPSKLLKISAITSVRVAHAASGEERFDMNSVRSVFSAPLDHFFLQPSSIRSILITTIERGFLLLVRIASTRAAMFRAGFLGRATTAPVCGYSS